MPVERQAISVNQFAELLGIDAARFIAVERPRRDSTRLYLVMEAEMQTTGTFPQIQGNAGYGTGHGKGSAKTPKGGGPKKA